MGLPQNIKYVGTRQQAKHVFLKVEKVVSEKPGLGIHSFTIMSDSLMLLFTREGIILVAL